MNFTDLKAKLKDYFTKDGFFKRILPFILFAAILLLVACNAQPPAPPSNVDLAPVVYQFPADPVVVPEPRPGC